MRSQNNNHNSDIAFVTYVSFMPCAWGAVLKKRELRWMKLLLLFFTVAVVVAFFICWAPFHAQRLVAIYGTTENHLARSPILLSVYSYVTYISGVFYYMSTCINPIFYHIMSNKFRDAFKVTINCLILINFLHIFTTCS